MTDCEKLDLLLSEMQNIQTNMQNMQNNLQSIQNDMQNIKSDMQNMKDDTQNTKTDMQTLMQKVTNIDLTIKNELRVNIQRVAEGHLDLSRNLHEVIKSNSEVEMLAIKVRMLESDMRNVKAKLA